MDGEDEEERVAEDDSTGTEVGRGADEGSEEEEVFVRDGRGTGGKGRD